jgi:signal transduction histidine kinase
MTTAVSSARAPESSPAAFPWRDAIIVASVTLAITLVAVRLELSEWVFAATRRWEHLQLDELPATLVALTLCLCWFAWRRSREARSELALRRAAEAEMSRLLLENRRLAQQYVQVQEAERKFLARELHDELGQYLNAIKLDAVAIQQRAPAEPLARACAGILAHTDHVHAVVRDLIRRLRPIGLDELGLSAALEHYVENWRARVPRVQVEAAFDPAIDSLAEAQAMSVYRLVQEGLTNVSRHARAQRVEVSAQRNEAKRPAVTIRITDDGDGADLGVRPRGLGLVGMRERLEAFGGTLRIDTAPGKGFRIEATLPCGEST